MGIFFTEGDLQRAKTKLQTPPWPGFDSDYLTQAAPVSMIDGDGNFQYPVVRFDGDAFAKITTYDTKFASWIITEGAMAASLGLGAEYLTAARSWVAAAINTPVWDCSQKGHIDLDYGNFAYACAFFHDLCSRDCDGEFQQRLEVRMLEEVKRGAERFSQRPVSRHPYTQNHFYIPFTGYLCMCAVLKYKYEECADRLEEAKVFMPLIFDGLGRDGWYYEGMNYFHFAVIWLVRLAMLAEQHLGMELGQAEFFRGLAEYLKWNHYPQSSSFFQISDNSPKKWNFTSWEEAAELDESNWNDTWMHNNSHILYWTDRKGATTNGSVTARTIGENTNLRWNEGFWKLLWEQTEGTASKEWDYHIFHDFGVWACDRKSPRGDTLRILTKCGPPMGHSLRLDEHGVPEYSYNAGHVHPDAGSVFAAWNDLPVLLGPGYLGRKAGIYLNSLTINSLGQQDDRLYHALDQDVVNYSRLKELSITGDDSGVKMDFTAAYRERQGVLRAVREVESINAECFEIRDAVELSTPGRIEARFRISDPPTVCGDAFEWTVGYKRMRLALLDNSCPVRLQTAPGMVTTINDGKTSGPLEAGLTCQRGYQLIITTANREKSARWCFRIKLL